MLHLRVRNMIIKGLHLLPFEISTIIGILDPPFCVTFSRQAQTDGSCLKGTRLWTLAIRAGRLASPHFFLRDFLMRI
jgi:hypothetical protein